LDHKTKQLKREGVTLNYLDEGQGPAVLLVHGFPDSIQPWRQQVPALLDAGYRVIADINIYRAKLFPVLMGAIQYTCAAPTLGLYHPIP
jgi:hypothetical protein